MINKVCNTISNVSDFSPAILEPKAKIKIQGEKSSNMAKIWQKMKKTYESDCNHGLS